MSAAPFTTYEPGADPAAAFRAAHARASYEHGQDGDTRTIASKGSYTVIVDTALPYDVAHVLAQKLIAAADERISDTGDRRVRFPSDKPPAASWQPTTSSTKESSPTPRPSASSPPAPAPSGSSAPEKPSQQADATTTSAPPRPSPRTPRPLNPTGGSSSAGPANSYPQGGSQTTHTATAHSRTAQPKQPTTKDQQHFCLGPCVLADRRSRGDRAGAHLTVALALPAPCSQDRAHPGSPPGVTTPIRQAR